MTIKWRGLNMLTLYGTVLLTVNKKVLKSILIKQTMEKLTGNFQSPRKIGKEILAEPGL